MEQMTPDAYCLTILGKPVAKQSGKISLNRKTGKRFIRTDQKAVNYANWVRLCWLNQFPKAKPLQGLVDVTILACFQIPKSYTKKRRKQIAEMGWGYDQKPDPDNICKNLLDALEGLAFTDDKLVRDVTIRRRYTESRPRAEVWIDRVLPIPLENEVVTYESIRKGEKG